MTEADRALADFHAGQHTHKEPKAALVALIVACAALLVAVVLIAGYIVQRGQVRDAEQRQAAEQLQQAEQRRAEERAYLQAQLDEQATVLCIAIRDFRARTDDGTKTAETLDEAARNLGCAFLPVDPPTRPGPATPTTEQRFGPPADEPAQAESGQPGPPQPVAPPAADVADEPTPPQPPLPPPPAPAPPPAEPPGDGLLEPITDPICQLSGICL